MIKIQFQKVLPIFISLLFMCSCSGGDERVRYTKVGTGSQVGVYYAAGLALADFVNEQTDKHHVDVAVESTDGSVFNINALMAGELDFGFTQADRQFQAVRGKANWENNPQEKLRFICSFHMEAVTLVAADDSSIDLLPQIKERRVSLGSPASGTQGNAVDAMSAVGLVPERDFDAEYLQASEASMMLQDGRIDAFFYTVGHPNGSLTEATNGTRKVHFVPILGMAKLIRHSPYYTKTMIPIEHYPRASNLHDVPTVGMLTTFVTSTDVDEEVVYQTVKSLFENIEKLKSRHPSFALLTPQGMLRGAFAPMHPGAEKYYREAGLL